VICESSAATVLNESIAFPARYCAHHSNRPSTPQHEPTREYSGQKASSTNTVRQIQCLLHTTSRQVQSRPADLSLDQPIDLFGGDFTIPLRIAAYRLTPFLRQLDRLQSCPRAGVPSEQIIRVTSQTVNIHLPVHVCALLTTSISLRAGKTKRSVVPGQAKRHRWRDIGGGSEHEPRSIWRRRSCPTKFQVEYLLPNMV
jgi:hypothetical protein